MNHTRIDLMYRDGCNYKAYSYIVFTGAPDPVLVQRLTASLEGGRQLVPEQVGLSHPGGTEFAPRFPDEEDDHGWTDVMGAAAVDAEASDGRTFAAFVAACEKASAEGWDPMIAIEAHGGWTDPEAAAKLRGGEDDEDDEEGDLVFPKFVTLDEPDMRNLPERPVPDGQVRLVLEIENAYELYGDVTTYADVMVPAPPADDETPDPAGEHETAYQAWAYTHIYPLTGVGHADGDSWYDATVVWSSDAALVGSTFDWGY